MASAPPGVFITFEGLDGTGKSTQLALTAGWLRGHGLEVVECREPGSTPLGERLRELLLATRGPGIAPAAELALMFAARAQLVESVIRPALARGAWVLADRYVDASVAYQGGGRGLPMATIHELHRRLCGDLWPDLTLVLELPSGAALDRARVRDQASQQGRFEAETDAFFARVAAAYRDLAARQPGRCRLIQAWGAVEAVQEQIRAAVRERTAHVLV